MVRIENASEHANRNRYIVNLAYEGCPNAPLLALCSFPPVSLWKLPMP
jgi:hypothetical protein